MSRVAIGVLVPLLSSVTNYLGNPESNLGVPLRPPRRPPPVWSKLLPVLLRLNQKNFTGDF